MKLHVIFQIIFGHGQNWSTQKQIDTELAYLTEITLPSLAAQSDENFRLLMLCDDALDDNTRDRIRHAVWAQLDRRKAKVIFRGSGHAAKQLTKSTNGRWTERPWRVQVALDHDAAVANDFVARMRSASLTRIKKMRSAEDYVFLAFGAQYGLAFDKGDAQLFEKPSRRGDSGLALLSAQGHELSPFTLRGKPISADHPIDVLGGSKPFVLSLLCERGIRVARKVASPGDDRAVLDAVKRFSWLGRAIDAMPRARVH